MIYSGTFPGRPSGDDQFNVVNMGATSRGKWGRSLVKHGKNAGANKIPAQGFLTLGRYWSDHMPAGDRDWWHARGQATWHGTRYSVAIKPNGYALFIMANAAAYALKEKLVLLPIPFTDESHTDSLWHQVEADKNRCKFYFWWETMEPTAYQSDIFVSVVKAYNLTDKDPMKATKLVGMHHPQEVNPFGFWPQVPVYHPLPFAINVGIKVGVHRIFRGGARTGSKLFRVLAWASPLYAKPAV